MNKKMKKLVLSIGVLALIVMAGFSAMAQQGKWAGLVKYKLTWTGNVPQGVPEEWEVKVFENLAGQVDLSTMGLGKSIANANNNVVMTLFDFSMIPDEGPYEGMSGKWYVKSKITEEKLKEMLKDTKYEYTGKKKEIAGLQCEEVLAIFKDAEGEEVKETIYVTKEIGPKMDLTTYPGLDAFPMEYPLKFSDALSVTFTASELLKGKVKDTDLMLESGYEEISEEDLGDMLRVLFGGGGEDEEDM